MERLRSILMPSALALAVVACGDEPCPSGSEDIDGICQPVTDAGMRMDGGRALESILRDRDGGLHDGDLQGAAGMGGETVEDSGVCDVPCGEHARCEAAGGSSRCVCIPGYEGDGVTCTRDPCQPLEGEEPPCDERATCSALEGELQCTCMPGYDGTGAPGDCTRLPCMALAGEDPPCDDNAQCTLDDSGAPQCACLQGYEGSGAFGDCTRQPCTPLAGEDPPCDEHASCSADGDQAVCTCDAGYTGDGTSCSDVDECATEQHDCDPNAECSNTVGGFECTCQPGYEGDGVHCADINECARGMHDCDPNATCTNEAGSFQCDCIQGYEGDGTSCTRDPCQPLSGESPPCGANTSCQVQDGAAVCMCEEGFADCDGSPNSCETDLGRDPAHCGACGYACAGNLACEAGSCEQALEAIALGYRHSCGFTAGGEPLCWGDDSQGQLQRPEASELPDYEPGPTLGNDLLSRLAAGSDHACGVAPGGQLQCWGSNALGALGGAGGEFPELAGSGFVELADYPDVPLLGVGIGHQCVFSNNVVECWGLNNSLQVGSDATSDFGPIATYADRHEFPAGAFADVTAFALGSNHSCVLFDEGEIECWGDNSFGQLGHSPLTSPTETPGQVLLQSSGSVLPDAVHASSYRFTTCAVMLVGTVFCWGANDTGQLGSPNRTEESYDRAVLVWGGDGRSLTGVVQVAVGSEHACARRDDGSVACWGRADRLGDGGSGTGAVRHAVDVPDIDDAIDIVAGEQHTCVRLGTGQVQCWGDNSGGQLGIDPNSVSERLIPTNVPGLP